MSTFSDRYDKAHHCGEQGFGMSVNDRCAACEREMSLERVGPIRGQVVTSPSDKTEPTEGGQK